MIRVNGQLGVGDTDPGFDLGCGNYELFNVIMDRFYNVPSAASSTLRG
jgi:hypothetical protein